MLSSQLNEGRDDDPNPVAAGDRVGRSGSSLGCKGAPMIASAEDMDSKQLLHVANQDIAPPMTKTRQVNFRFDPNTFERLQRQAEAEYRTVSNLVEKLVLEYLERCKPRERRTSAKSGRAR